VYCTYDPDTLGKDPADGRKAKGVIHWVSAEHAVPAEICLYDRLFSVPNPAAEDDYLSALNPDSCIIKNGVVEPSLANADVGAGIQFERTGYFTRDKELSVLRFNRTVGLRDTWENKS
jgi:glutaminyl-tRNA synthetase